MVDYTKMLSGRAVGLKPSGIRKFFDILGDKKDVISLTVGQPDFVTPWHIREAGIRSLEEGRTYYTSNNGLMELREQIALYQRRRFGLDYAPASEIIVTVGGSEAIDLALRALVNPGDEVIVPEPCFVCYAPLTTLAGGVPVSLPLKAENGFRLTADELRQAITPRTKALVLAFPNNPTGAVMSRENLEKVAEIAVEHDLIVLTDEIYSELLYEGEHVSIASLPGMRERTIFLHGFSKAFAMTGWRVGYACGPREIIDAMMKVHQYSIMCASTMAQEAALEALRNGTKSMQQMRDSYHERRDLMVNGFNRIGLECLMPKGAFYAFPSIRSTGLSSTEFAEELLKAEKVAVVPGSAFGACGEGFVRCCYAASAEDIIEAVNRMEHFLATLKR